MANENNNNGGNGGENSNSHRRGSITNSTFSALFGRSNSISQQGAPATPSAPPSLSNAPSSMSTSSARSARRISITTLGLNGAGTSPISASAAYFPSSAAARDRRTSTSTDSNAIDESAIEDDDATSASAQYAQSVPTTPFSARRMSIGGNGIFGGRGGPSPGTAPTSSHPSVSASGAGGSSTLFSIPARQATHHESAPLTSSSPFVPKQRTTSMSKPALGPSGLSQGLGAAGGRRTSLSGAPGVHARHGSVSSATSGAATISSPAFPGGAGLSSSLAREAGGRKQRTLSDYPGSSNAAAGLDWSEQFRSRAESTASRPAQHRASFGAAFSAGAGNQTSPNAEARPMAIGGLAGQQAKGGAGMGMHQRAGSIGGMMGQEGMKEGGPVVKEQQQQQPQQQGLPKEKKSWLSGGGKKPDEVGERILRGEFLMD